MIINNKVKDLSYKNASCLVSIKPAIETRQIFVNHESQNQLQMLLYQSKTFDWHSFWTSQDVAHVADETRSCELKS